MKFLQTVAQSHLLSDKYGSMELHSLEIMDQQPSISLGAHSNSVLDHLAFVSMCSLHKQTERKLEKAN